MIIYLLKENREMVLSIAGWFVGWIVLVVVIFLGVSHSISEQERVKDLRTESDLFNYYKGE
jgi:hypothetical protein